MRAGQLLLHDREAELARAGAALLAGERRTEEAELPHLRHEPLRDVLLPLDLLHVRTDLMLREVAHRGAQRNDLRRQLERHGALLCV